MNIIKNILSKAWSPVVLKGKITKLYHDNNRVLGECAHINTRRLFYLSVISIPIRILSIILFSTTASNDTLVLQTWNQGIITSHYILLIFMVGFFITTYRLRNRIEPNKTMFILQYLAVGVLMITSIAIVSIDQMVTTNITPFLLTCIFIGLVFLIRPLISFIMYATSYVAYYYIIAINITNPEVLLSNRVNGITAIGIGFLLSFILWHYNYTNITQRRLIKVQQKQLEQMAYYDSLTDLPNRRLLDKLVKQEFSIIQRHGYETVIIMLDLDDFKNINDTYGHPVGDDILRQIADLLKNNIRESDTVARFGGEEFIILMPHTSLEGGYEFAERLRKLIMEHQFIIGAITLRITASFGISLLQDINNQNSKDYFFLADKALYVAKQSGKNRVEIANGNGASQANPYDIIDTRSTVNSFAPKN